MALHVQVYYWPIAFTNCFPSAFPDSIKGGPPFVLTDISFISLLYRSLDTVNKPNRFNKYDLRLLVEAADGKPAYFMDGEGSVRRGTAEYQISPFAFYEVATMMDRLTVERFESQKRKK